MGRHRLRSTKRQNSRASHTSRLKPFFRVFLLSFELQIFGQRNISAAPAAIVMSLEGVVAAISAWLILNQILGINNIIGCTLILGGILLSQLAPIYEKNYK